jgi:hypothetical protein
MDFAYAEVGEYLLILYGYYSVDSAYQSFVFNLLELAFEIFLLGNS